jgi:hypothetical protein
MLIEGQLACRGVAARRFVGGFLAVLLAVVGLVACGSPARQRLPPGAIATGPCAKPSPSNPVFARTHGNHLIDTRGRVMVPTGMTVYGLALRHWRLEVAQDDAQIRAAVTRWCTSYIRLQVAPALLLSPKSYSEPYLAAVESEVQLALSYDQNVVLTAQTERFSNEPENDPTMQTVRFWKVLAPIYRADPRVWFDLFNEPRLKTAPDKVWHDWEDGVDVKGQQYVGMQQLVGAVRQVAGASNLILVEGPGDSENFNQLPEHLIAGVNVAYAAHAYGQTQSSQWNKDFGNAARTVPVVVDEWGEWDRHDSGPGGECSPDAASFVPQFFAYLRQHQIGLGGWALIPGVLVTNTITFTPTMIRSDYQCSTSGQQAEVMTKDQSANGALPVPDAQGAGELLKTYFTQVALASRK